MLAMLSESRVYSGFAPVSLGPTTAVPFCVLVRVFSAYSPETLLHLAIDQKYHASLPAARYKFAGEIWSIASEDSKHFIRSLLQKTPRLRLTVAQAQEHRWLRKAEEISQEPRGDLQFAEGMMRSLLDFR